MNPIKLSIFNKNTDPANPKQIYPAVRAVTQLDSLAALAEFISNPSPSFAWSPSIFKDDYRKREKFQEVTCLVLDYDSKGSVQDALEAYKAAGYQFILGTSISHQVAKNDKPARDRYRVIVPMTKSITDASLMQYNLEQLTLSTFPFFDVQVLVDSSRAYLACKDIVHIQTEGRLWEPLTEQIYGSLAFKEFVDGFLINTPAQGEGFNKALLIACKKMQGAGYSQAECESFMERFIFDERFNPEGWSRLSKEDKATIKSAYSTPPGPSLMTRAEFNKDKPEEATKHIITELIPKYITKHITKTDSFYFEILDFENKVVDRVENLEYLYDLIRRKVLSGSSLGIPNNIAEAKKLFKAWDTVASTLDKEPEPFAQIEDKYSWAYAKIDLAPEPGPTPAWDEFLNRLSAADDFLAWVWSIFETQHKGRQALWLYGHNGQDGKSTVLKVIQRVFKGAGCGISDQNLDTNFGLSALLGKRFAVYADCLNTRFLQKEKIRHITTGDITTIEFKGKTPFSTEMYVRLAIASNLPPSINKTNAETSRLLLINVKATKDNTAGWEEKLEAELPRLLFKARAAYNDKCPEHYNIKVSAATIIAVKGASEVGAEYFETIFDEKLVADVGAQLKAKDLQDIFTEYRIQGPEQMRFREFLKNYIEEQIPVTDGSAKIRTSKGNAYLHVRLKNESTTLTSHIGSVKLDLDKKQLI